MAVALTTRFWAPGSPGGTLTVGAFLDAFGRSGAESLVLDATLDPQRYEALTGELLRGTLPLLAVEGPCPRTRVSEAQLCSPARDEARAALEAVEDTVMRAGELGARFVVIRLGEPPSLGHEWNGARRRFLRAELDAQQTRRLAELRRRAGEEALEGAWR